MSHLPTPGSLTSSRRPSQSSPVVAQPSPSSPSRSPTIGSGTNVMAILNNRVIPRNYLNVKPSPASQSTEAFADPLDGLGDHTRQPDRSPFIYSGPEESRPPFTPTPPTPSGKDTPDSDLLAYDDLKIVRTRSPEFSDFPASPKRQVPKPDSPTLHLDNNPLRVIMPRTSSIDSAISTVSTTSAQNPISNSNDLNPTSVRALINAAGSPENLIVHLLKDKNTVAAQNAQLWKLVEKQRALLLGLNKDLERASKERDRYKRKLKELQQTVGTTVKPSRSPAHGGHPSKEQTDRDLGPGTEGVNGTPYVTAALVDRRSPMDPAMMPRPLHSRDNSRSQIIPEERNPGQSDEDTISRTDVDERPIQLQDSTGLNQVEAASYNTSPPILSVAGLSPVSDKSPRAVPSSRKAPPRPLNLAKQKEGRTASYQDSVASELTSVDEEPERGRRRTREDDDRERERSAVQEEDARSRSKKKGKSVSKSAVKVDSGAVEQRSQQPSTLPPAGLPLSPRPQHAQALLSPMMPHSGTLGAMKSPGLPVSPRPMHNTATFAQQLPLSPRANAGGFPLSPRAPKQPLPVPTDPAASVDPALFQSTQRPPHHNPLLPKVRTDVDRLHLHEPPTSDPPSIYRGLVDASYPNLLLPPNALPSILVKVVSSRQRPSRNSVLGVRSQEDTVVFSLSVTSRSSNSELWRIEKVPSTLLQLEQQLKPRCSELPKMPDRKLFSGHSPALLDARRKAVDEYFEQLLDTHVDEQAGVMISTYLSTDVLDPDTQESRPKTMHADSPIHHIAKAAKTGYLTKKGKNFGGWKSRFFVLEGHELRYYESASGSHLGTIKLQHAQVGRPKQDEAQGEDNDGQFRHAFLIQEPKRKDSTTYIRHVLCAESDEDRDEWVKLLMKASEGVFNDFPTISRKRSASMARDDLPVKDVSRRTPSPPITNPSNPSSPSRDSHPREARPPTTAISGPLHGSVIKDASAWGQKGPPVPPPTVREGRDKGFKMSNIFSSKKAEPAPVEVPDHKPKPRILRHNGYVRPVFGLPLADAVEFCAPFHVDVDLPAVVYRCIEYLRFRKAANEEGLFRLSGSNSSVRMLRERFNTEGDVDLVVDEKYHDVHAVTSLFKSYLRELPSSILTRDLHVEFMKVLELSDVPEKVSAYNTLVRRLPRINFVLLKELSHYLLEVTQSADKNKMSVRNMGIVFSPTLNIPPPVFTLFLTEFEAIFVAEPGDARGVRPGEVRAPDPAPPAIRSPRRQAFSDLPSPAHHQTTFPGLPSHPHDKGHRPHPGDFGFIPVHASYESGSYVSHLQDASRPAAAVPNHDPSVSSMNGMLAPATGATTSPERRESALIFSTIP